jgi:hypothetical protein
VGFGPISKKNSLVRIKEYLYNRSIINVVAPAETANQEETENFYVNLSNLMTLLHNIKE